MSQSTAAANFSRIQSRRNASTVGGGGGGDRCRCCGGGVGVPIVSTHAVSSACCQPSASNSTISTSRRLRDGRATPAARRTRDGRATALRGRTWRDRCGVAKAMTPVSSKQFVGCLAAQPAQQVHQSLRLMPPLPRDLQNAARRYRCSPCHQANARLRHWQWHEPCPVRAPAASVRGGRRSRTKKRCLRKRGKRSGDARERLEHPHHQNRRRVDTQNAERRLHRVDLELRGHHKNAELRE